MSTDLPQPVLLRGHPREVVAVAFSGLEVVSLCRAGFVHRWDARGRLRDGLALPWTPSAALIGGSGRWILGGGGSRVELLEAATGRPLLRWRIPCEPLVGLAASSDFRRLAVLFGPARERRLQVWQPEGSPVSGRGGSPVSLPAPADLRKIFLDPSGAALWGLGRGGIWLWQLAEGQAREVQFRVNLTAADLSPTAGLAALGDLAGVVRVVEVPSGELRWKHQAVGMIGSLAFSPRGECLAWEDRGHSRLRVHEARSGRCLAELETCEEVTALAFDEVGRRLVSGHASGSLAVWNLDAGEIAAFCPALENPVTALAFSPDGATLAVGESLPERGEVTVWDLVCGAPPRFLGELGLREVSHLSCSRNGRLACFSRPGRAVVQGAGVINLPDPGAVALSPDGELLAHRERTGSILLWSLGDATLVAQLPCRRRTWISGPTLLPELSSGVRFSPDGELLYAAEDGPWLRAWEPASGDSRRVRLSQAEGRLHLLAVSGRWLAVWERRRVHLLDRASLAPVSAFPVGSGVTGAISACEGFLAVGYPSGEVRLYRCPEGELVRELRPHRDQVTALAFSPDGAWLASGSLDGTTVLWQGETSATLARIPPRGWIAFEPGGRFDASPDQSWLRWRTAPPALEPGLLARLRRERPRLVLEGPAAPSRLEGGSAPPGPPPPSGGSPRRP